MKRLSAAQGRHYIPDFQYADTHLHFDFYTQNECADIASLCITERLLIIAVAMNEKSYEQTRLSAAGCPYIIPCFGIHPSQAGSPIDEKRIQSLVKHTPLVGEIGLDFFWVWDKEKNCPVEPEFSGCSPERQESVFSLILDCAQREQRPCIIHTKGAEKRIYDILQDFPHLTPIVHWYSGDERIFSKMMERGYYASFSSELGRNPLIQRLAQMPDTDRLLAETDNPDAEPWLGGSDRSPLLVKQVTAQLARVRGLAEEDMRSILEKNTRRLLAH